MKRSETISGAIGLLDEDIIEEANEKRTAEKKIGMPLLIKILSAAACISVIAGAIAIAPHDDGTGLLTITEGTTAGAPTAAGGMSGNAEITTAGTSEIRGTEPPETNAGGTSDTSLSEPPEDITTAGTYGTDVTEPPESVTSEGTSEAPPSEPSVIRTTAERVPVVISADRKLISVRRNASPLSLAVYPETVKKPELSHRWDQEAYDLWRKDAEKRLDAGNKINAPEDFYKVSAAEFLTGSGGKNRVYSPVNTYMALAMLAETAGGESRYQILDLLGEKDINSLRSQAKNIWNANYRDDGTVTSVLANSLWLDDGLRYDPGTSDFIAENYLASLYGGDLSSEEMQKFLRDWINEQTGGLLKESVKKIELPPETLMTLCSTIYFRAKWENEFRSEWNTSMTFHGRKSDAETEFMTATDYYKTYFRGKDFGAIYLMFSSCENMWFILPDEGASADEILASGEYLEMINSGDSWENRKEMMIHYYVPKFDISSDIDLADSLKKLGVTDVFDAAASDFSPLTDDALFLDKVRHSARVKIDEEGCIAAAFTVELGAGAGMPEDTDELDFILDRPFIFVITSATHQPLFIGTVNQL